MDKITTDLVVTQELENAIFRHVQIGDGVLPLGYSQP